MCSTKNAYTESISRPQFIYDAPMGRILVFGTFDGLHPGHMYFLQQAQALGALHVVVAHDETVKKVKNHPPQHTQSERCRVLQKKFPDAVVMPGGTSGYLLPVQHISPDLVCLGYDQSLPPGVTADMIPCPMRRLLPMQPERYKSSLMRDGRPGSHCKNRANEV